MNKKLKSAKFEKFDPEQGDMNRRNFLQTSLKALGALAALELGGAGLLFLRSYSLDGEFGGVMTLGKVDEFTNGSVVEYEDGNLYLVRDDNGGFMAIYRRCPHLGCTVKWSSADEKFYCPCHSATFDEHGEFKNQLVSRALDTFPVSFSNGMVKVDTSALQMREHHAPEDIKYFTAKESKEG
jgi:cytochrome b6-f complex iron-sulfur subunit